MNTNLRSQTSRENGSKSNGPVTQEGKSRSSRNSIRHGLTSKTVVLPTESQDDFNELLNDYLTHFAPRNPIETDLVHDMATARWRLIRIHNLETSLIDADFRRRDDEFPRIASRSIDERMALTFRSLAENSTSLHMILRYESSLSRTFDRALKHLLTLQKLHVHSRSLTAIQNEPTNHQPEPPQPPAAQESFPAVPLSPILESADTRFPPTESRDEPQS